MKLFSHDDIVHTEKNKLIAENKNLKKFKFPAKFRMVFLGCSGKEIVIILFFKAIFFSIYFQKITKEFGRKRKKNFKRI